MARPTGPIEEHPWPERLPARVITPGADPHVHGYSVEHDLAQHYRFTDLVLLSLTGELPSEEQSAVFEVALVFLAPLSVAEGPTHAAVLARICGARPSSVGAIAAVTTAERARSLVEDHTSLFAWLAGGEGEPPDLFHATTDDERASVEALRQALAARGVTLKILAHDLSRSAALLAVLHACGLVSPAELEGVLLIASLAPSLGEAARHAVASFREYPMQLPRFEYEDP